MIFTRSLYTAYSEKNCHTYPLDVGAGKVLDYNSLYFSLERRNPMNSATALNCKICGHTSDFREFVWTNDTDESICQNAAACQRRQARDSISNTVAKPKLHVVDRFSRSAIITCASFLTAASAVCGSYVIFGF
jgi:hypothetical protein